MAELNDEQKKKLAEYAAKDAARAAELSAYAGKTFKRKGDTGPTTYHIVRYDGIKEKDLVKAHTFLVDIKNPAGRFTPQATKFLEDFEEITPAIETPVDYQEVL